ncbi:CinA family nicotinamide mononucleotide deamidase-related protein, partial [Shewanella chilikensis]|uniref:CinA family nicotinamide mononucleotide deamidase-related protein n=1 Tax=Shewanella chilikensis TaxID=558541 RepID=UPI001F16279C
MKLEMICTGEEVLSGQIVDTNAAWFANVMMEHGIEVQRRVTVGDRLEDLIAVFQERSLHADVILVNGGLGPTSDDLSAEAMAKSKGESLVENAEWRAKMEAWFSRNNREMPASNLKQALLPESAVMVDNPVGTACGFRVKLNRAWLYFTPGVPFELKHMVKEQFLPFIKQEFGLDAKVALNKLLTLGHGESTLADKLEALELPAGITVGYRSSMPHIEIKLFARGDKAIALLPRVTNHVRQVLGTAVVAENRATLAEEIHHRLLNSGLSLSLAESCTGGMLTSQLVAFPGSSSYLH